MMIRLVSDSCGFFGRPNLAREVSRHWLWMCGPQVAEGRYVREKVTLERWSQVVRPRDLPEADVFAD